MTVYTKLIDGEAVQMSAEEIAARQAEEAAWAAGADARFNAEIDAQIATLEQDSLLARGAREIFLPLMVQAGAGAGLSEPELYSAQNGYRKLKDLDDQIKALRAQRKPV